MHYKIYILLPVILLSYIFQSYSQENKLHIAFDAAVFNNSEYDVVLELYFSTPDNMFTYLNDSENDEYLKGKINIIFELKDNNNTIIKQDSWVIENKIISMEDLKKNYIFGVKKYIIPSGQYKLHIEANDKNNISRTASYTKDIYVSKFENNRINQSDIEFASYMEKTENSIIIPDSIYLKDSYYIIPNPRAEFYGNGARLLGALEIYNADRFASAGILRSFKIYDNTNNIVFYRKDSCLEISKKILTKFDIILDTLNSGVYYLSVSSSYPIESPVDSVTSTKKFFYFNQNKPPVIKRYFTENEKFEKSEFNALDYEQTENELEMALVIANADEIYQAKSLTDIKAKQRFLFKFWLQRDTSTSNSWNEKLITFRKNVEYANNFFSYGKNLKGWKTERGKTLLKYGMPTQRDVTLSTGLDRSYEEWFYENVQGGVYFYFVDMSSIGNFILVHSTAMNETYFPDWFNRYVPTTNDRRIQNESNSNNPYGN